jgi:hypothetical protein
MATHGIFDLAGREVLICGRKGGGGQRFARAETGSTARRRLTDGQLEEKGGNEEEEDGVTRSWLFFFLLENAFFNNIPDHEVFSVSSCSSTLLTLLKS